MKKPFQKLEAAILGCFLIALIVQGSVSSLCAQTQNVPSLVNYQGRVIVGATNFNGSGQFKFALVDGPGTTSFWSNDGTSDEGSAPTAAVTLPVNNGYYSVMLGDSSLANMTVLPASVFSNPDVRLRVWFNDGTHGFEMLTPDQRIGAAPYAIAAATGVPNGIKEFRTAEEHRFTVPEGITRIDVSGWGGGGGAGASSSGAGGGGAGAYARKIFTVKPLSELTITVGAAGNGTVGGQGTDGGDTIIELREDANVTILFSAAGGKGGSPSAGGAGGMADETAAISRAGGDGTAMSGEIADGIGGDIVGIGVSGGGSGGWGNSYTTVITPEQPPIVNIRAGNGVGGYLILTW